LSPFCQAVKHLKGTIPQNVITKWTAFEIGQGGFASEPDMDTLICEKSPPIV
jgi:hypothetical protein